MTASCTIQRHVNIFALWLVTCRHVTDVKVWMMSNKLQVNDGKSEALYIFFFLAQVKTQVTIASLANSLLQR